jgi:hypothetical protein
VCPEICVFAIIRAPDGGWCFGLVQKHESLQMADAGHPEVEARVVEPLERLLGRFGAFDEESRASTSRYPQCLRRPGRDDVGDGGPAVEEQCCCEIAAPLVGWLGR